MRVVARGGLVRYHFIGPVMYHQSSISCRQAVLENGFQQVRMDEYPGGYAWK